MSFCRGIVYRGTVTAMDAVNSSVDALDGSIRPIPPNVASSESSLHSTSLGGDLPVNAGISFFQMVSSSGCRRWPMLGVVWAKYIHLLANPCVMEAYAAWDWVLAVKVSFHSIV